MELRNAVSAKFGTELPATATFDHPTVAALAAFVAARMAPAESTAAADDDAWQYDSGAAPAQQAASAAAAQDVQRRLQLAVDELLGFPVAADMPLMEAGLDSIGAQTFICTDPEMRARCSEVVCYVGQVRDPIAHSGHGTTHIIIEPSALSIPSTTYQCVCCFQSGAVELRNSVSAALQ